MNIVTSVQPPLQPLAPRFKKWIFVFLAGIGGWLYIRFLLRICKIKVTHMDRLTAHFRRFQDKKIRLIVAFRHPTVSDPSVVFYVLSNHVQRAALREGRPLAPLSRACFIYDRGIPLWLGPVGNIALPGLGGISLSRGKVDPVGIRTIRSVLLNGEHPLAMAPEGANTYHTDVIGKLTPGLAHFAFWCAEDLRRAGRTEEVVVLPVSVTYRYRDPQKKWFAALLEKIESECFPDEERAAAQGISKQQAFERLARIREHLIAEAEDFYSRFFHHDHLLLNKAKRLQERIDAVTDAALRTVESFFGLNAGGDYVDRQHVAEQAAWDWIYRNDITDSQRLPPLTKALADRVAVEASLRMHHVQLADILMYLRDDYLEETSDSDRFIEALANLDGIMARLRGGDISHHAPRPPAEAEVTIGEPLAVVGRLPDYKTDRKKAIAALMLDLKDAYGTLIGDQRASRNAG